MSTLKEALEYLVTYLDKGNAILVVGLQDLDPQIPNIHNFYPKKYWESIEHLGYGFFEGKTEHGEFSFDGGFSMHNIDLKEGEKVKWLSWSLLRASPEVLQDLGYDISEVKRKLQKIMETI